MIHRQTSTFLLQLPATNNFNVPQVPWSVDFPRSVPPAEDFQGIIHHHEGVGVDVKDHFFHFGPFSQGDDAENDLLVIAGVGSRAV